MYFSRQRLQLDTFVFIANVSNKVPLFPRKYKKDVYCFTPCWRQMENKSEISAQKSKRNDFGLFKTQIFISRINKN